LLNLEALPPDLRDLTLLGQNGCLAAGRLPAAPAIPVARRTPIQARPAAPLLDPVGTPPSARQPDVRAHSWTRNLMPPSPLRPRLTELHDKRLQRLPAVAGLRAGHIGGGPAVPEQRIFAHASEPRADLFQVFWPVVGEGVHGLPPRLHSRR
jgi:hypothetical protein